MKSTASLAALLILVGLSSACSSSPDESCETVSEDVVLGISQGMDSGAVIVGDAAGIRDGEFWDVAGVIDVGASDNQVGVWRVRQDPAEPTSVGPISASDLFAANYSDWPTNLLESDVVDRAASCVSA